MDRHDPRRDHRAAALQPRAGRSRPGRRPRRDQRSRRGRVRRHGRADGRVRSRRPGRLPGHGRRRRESHDPGVVRRRGRPRGFRWDGGRILGERRGAGRRDGAPCRRRRDPDRAHRRPGTVHRHPHTVASARQSLDGRDRRCGTGQPRGGSADRLGGATRRRGLRRHHDRPPARGRRAETSTTPDRSSSR